MSEKKYCLTVSVVVLILFVIALSLLPPTTPAKTEAVLPEPQKVVLVVKPDYTYTYAQEIQQKTPANYNVPLDIDTQNYLQSVCEQYNVEPALVLAMIETESNFNTNAISRTNDYGLMQINKCNHERLKAILGVTDFLDAKQNMLCGVYMISKALSANNYDYIKALMCYNMGANGAARAWNRGITSTEYTDKVMVNIAKYQ